MGVIQELYALLLAHYPIRVMMPPAALQAGVSPAQLRFVHALRVLQEALLEFQITAPAVQERVYGRLLRDIAR